jgi:hypothetical protein
MSEQPIRVLRTERETEICQALGTSLDSNCQPRYLMEIVGCVECSSVGGEQFCTTLVLPMLPAGPGSHEHDGRPLHCAVR